MGFTLDQVAAECGVSTPHLSKIERKKQIPRADLLARLDAWFEEQRRKKRLPASHRLTWDWDEFDSKGAA